MYYQFITTVLVKYMNTIVTINYKTVETLAVF